MKKDGGKRFHMDFRVVDALSTEVSVTATTTLSLRLDAPMDFDA